MSVESVSDSNPLSSTLVFGSGVSQTKQQLNNEVEGEDKLKLASSVNGHSEKVNNTNGDGSENNTKESVNGTIHTNGSVEVHINGQNEKELEIKQVVKSDDNAIEKSSSEPESTQKPSENEAISESSNEKADNVVPLDAPVASSEPDPTLTTSTDTTNVESTSKALETSDETAAVNSSENVSASTTAPETEKCAESKTPEPKSRTPRGKAKSPAVSTPPTRQSTRSRKSTTPLTDNKEAESVDDINGLKTNENEPSPSPKRAKRQAAMKNEDNSKKSDEPSAISGDDLTERVNKPNDVIEETKTPSPRRGTRTTASGSKKREASSSPSVVVTKKPKASPRGKTSLTPNDEQNMDVDETKGNATVSTPVKSDNESNKTPTKKARTSANKKTPTATSPESNEEYVRKLRPRK